MFRNLPAFLPSDALLRKLAKQMVEPEPKPGTEDESGDNPDIGRRASTSIRSTGGVPTMSPSSTTPTGSTS